MSRNELMPWEEDEKPRPWPPTQQEVDAWLAHYQRWCAGHQPLPPGMRAGGGDQFSSIELRLGKFNVPDAETQLWLDQMEIFERAYGAYERFRTSIGRANGIGYEAGRANRPREDLPYRERRHETFSWLNGWAVGNFDYLWRAGFVCLMPSAGQRARRLKELGRVNE